MPVFNQCSTEKVFYSHLEPKKYNLSETCFYLLFVLLVWYLKQSGSYCSAQIFAQIQFFCLAVYIIFQMQPVSDSSLNWPWPRSDLHANTSNTMCVWRWAWMLMKSAFTVSIWNCCAWADDNEKKDKEWKNWTKFLTVSICGGTGGCRVGARCGQIMMWVPSQKQTLTKTSGCQDILLAT